MIYKQPWITVADRYLGLLEQGGAGDNKEIINFAKVLGGATAKEYTHDSIPWCGLFVGFVIASVGLQPVDGLLWALNWNGYGKKLTEPAFGCIVAFKRPSGGHVGFYVGEDSSTYHILGGNQSDSVSVTRIDKARAVGFRWPPGMDKFYVAGRVKRLYDAKISTNEK